MIYNYILAEYITADNESVMIMRHKDRFLVVFEDDVLFEDKDKSKALGCFFNMIKNYEGGRFTCV